MAKHNLPPFPDEVHSIIESARIARPRPAVETTERILRRLKVSLSPGGGAGDGSGSSHGSPESSGTGSSGPSAPDGASSSSSSPSTLNHPSPVTASSTTVGMDGAGKIAGSSVGGTGGGVAAGVTSLVKIVAVGLGIAGVGGGITFVTMSNGKNHEDQLESATTSRYNLTGKSKGVQPLSFKKTKTRGLLHREERPQNKEVDNGPALHQEEERNGSSVKTTAPSVLPGKKKSAPSVAAQETSLDGRSEKSKHRLNGKEYKVSKHRLSGKRLQNNKNQRNLSHRNKAFRKRRKKRQKNHLSTSSPPGASEGQNESDTQPGHISSSSLAEEKALLLRGRKALMNGQAHLARVALEEHQMLFPNGTLVEEREALMIRVMLKLGKIDAALKAAAAFHQHYPKSIFMAEIDAVLRNLR